MLVSACQQEPDIKVIVKSELANNKKCDNLLLGMKFGMADYELYNLSNSNPSFIKNTSDGKLWAQLLSENGESVWASLNTNYLNNRLNSLTFFIPSSDSENITLTKRLYKFLVSSFGEPKLQDDLIWVVWVNGNRRIDLIPSAESDMILIIFKDLSVKDNMSAN